MKKFTIGGLLIFLVVIAILLHWQHVKTSELDAAFLKNLPGTWMREENNLPHGARMPLSMRLTNIVATDGSFIELSWFSHSDRTNTYQRTGAWIIKNGRLVQTMKTSTNPSEKTPWIDTGRIVQADASKFTVRWKSDETWQKIVH